MSKMYCVFKPYTDGDGYLHWKFLFAATTLETALEMTSNIDRPVKFSPAHPDMIDEYDFTLVTTRDLVSQQYNIDRTTFDEVGGYVIEECDLH